MRNEIALLAVVAVAASGQAWAADSQAPIVNLQVADATAPSVTESALIAPDQGSGGSSDGGYFENWFARANEAQASQPHWMTPLVTVTPRLEQEVRYDQYFENRDNGSSLDISDSGKGLELIPTETNEVLINPP